MASNWNPPTIRKHETYVEPKHGQGRAHFGDAYMLEHSRTTIPEGIQELVNARNRLLDVDEHVFDQMI